VSYTCTKHKFMNVPCYVECSLRYVVRISTVLLVAPDLINNAIKSHNTTAINRHIATLDDGVTRRSGSFLTRCPCIIVHSLLYDHTRRRSSNFHATSEPVIARHRTQHLYLAFFMLNYIYVLVYDDRYATVRQCEY